MEVVPITFQGQEIAQYLAIKTFSMTFLMFLHHGPFLTLAFLVPAHAPGSYNRLEKD